MTDHSWIERRYLAQDLLGAYKNCSFLIAAPGPSLPSDIWMRDQLCAQYTTFALTWAMRWAETDLWLGMDHAPIDAYFADPTADVALLPEKFWNWIKGRGEEDRGRLFRNGSFREGKLLYLGETESRLVTDAGSLAAAVSAAVVLSGGFCEIYLIGADGGLSRTGARHHAGLVRESDSFKDHLPHEYQFDKAAVAMERLHEELDAMGIYHANATPGSKIPGWPIIDPEDLLR